MDMQTLQASFATQDQAESAMRKLASLRSDCFRLERTQPYAATQPLDNLTTFTSASLSTLDASLASASITSLAASPTSAYALGSAFQQPSYENAELDQGEAATGISQATPFSLSANVPSDATEQARTVIQQAGGKII